MVNREYFTEKLEVFHPKSSDYVKYWQEQKRRIIEGYWVGNYFCPPSLYFYLNFGTIWVKKSLHSKSQIKGRPRNLDYLYDKLSIPYLLSRGISGFEKTGNISKTEIKDILYNGSPSGALGKPLYENLPCNLLLLSNRGSGKTSWAANECVREFITDSAKEYIPGVNETKAEIIVGAYDAKFSSIPIGIIQLALSELPGSQNIGDRYYPSPLSKIISGSFLPSKDAQHLYTKKIGGKWKEFGTRSIIKHRTYKDNPFASQGGRYTLKLAEEIGMWNNLLECHYADENQVIGNSKLGTTIYIGTGGDMKGGGSLAAYKMFYDPEAYNCIAFDDVYENKGKIGLFLSAIDTKIDYKDEKGNTNRELGKITEEKIRESKKKAKDPGVYDEYLIYNPLIPSEIFLQTSSNIFPTVDLTKRLTDLETNSKYKDSEYIGDIYYDSDDNRYKWKPNPILRPIYDFPLTKKDNQGTPVIYEHPFELEDHSIPYGRYIAGMDPYDHDSSEYSLSLGSLLVYDRLHGRIVCEYTGRPSTANEFFETCRKILKYYNATCLYENEKKGFYQYLERYNDTYLLLDQPRVLKDITPDSKVNREKGMHMTDKFKKYGILMINNFLRASAEIKDAPEITNAQRIRCIPLLKELIMYNSDINADRVMAMVTLMYHIEELKKYEYKEENTIIPIQDSAFFKKQLFKKKMIYV